MAPEPAVDGTAERLVLLAQTCERCPTASARLGGRELALQRAARLRVDLPRKDEEEEGGENDAHQPTSSLVERTAIAVT